MDKVKGYISNRQSIGKIILLVVSLFLAMITVNIKNNRVGYIYQYLGDIPVEYTELGEQLVLELRLPIDIKETIGVQSQLEEFGYRVKEMQEDDRLALEDKYGADLEQLLYNVKVNETLQQGIEGTEQERIRSEYYQYAITTDEYIEGLNNLEIGLLPNKKVTVYADRLSKVFKVNILKGNILQIIGYVIIQNIWIITGIGFVIGLALSLKDFVLINKDRLLTKKETSEIEQEYNEYFDEYIEERRDTRKNVKDRSYRDYDEITKE